MGHTVLIAEAGVNHNGSLETALALVDAASESGADAVKFQTFAAERVMSRHAPKAAYQRQTTDAAESQLEMVKRLELDDAAHRAIIARCDERGVEFISSAGDLESLLYLGALGVRTLKIPSGDLANLPYLRAAGAMRKRVLLSTGMADLGEVEDALGVLLEQGTRLEDVTILQCTTEYPVEPAYVNLRAMVVMREAFGTAVGFSDHSVGSEMALAAVALGASVIEKHFTLDRTMEGPDHRASAEPADFAELVRAVRAVELGLGDGRKHPVGPELANRQIVRKSLVAAIPIAAGEAFTEDNVVVKRPGTGIDPMRIGEVLGRLAPREFDADELIEL